VIQSSFLDGRVKPGHDKTGALFHQNRALDLCLAG
jgi:hypothetical protein